MALIAPTPPEQKDGVSDMIQLARWCGLPPATLITAIQLLVEHCALAVWTLDHRTGDLAWSTAPASE